MDVTEAIKQYLIKSGAVRITEVKAPSEGVKLETRPIISISRHDFFRRDFTVYPVTQYRTLADMAVLERPTSAPAYEVKLNPDKTGIESVVVDPPLRKGARCGWICHIASDNPDASHYAEKVFVYAAPGFIKELSSFLSPHSIRL
jgi:hypothetical protein